MIASKALSLAAIVITAAYVTSAQAEVLIAVAGPITGQYEWTGEQQRRGAEMAVTDINAEGASLARMSGSLLVTTVASLIRRRHVTL